MGARGLSHPQHMLLDGTRQPPHLPAGPHGRAPCTCLSAPPPLGHRERPGAGRGGRGRGFSCGGRSHLATKVEGGAAASLGGCREAFLKFHFLSPFRGRCFCF